MAEIKPQAPVNGSKKSARRNFAAFTARRECATVARVNWMIRTALAVALLAVVHAAPAAASYSVTRLANGRFDLQFSGLGAAQYVIQTTTNFAAWTDLGYIQPTNGALRFIDNGATNLPLRFYRVVSNLNLLTLSGTVRDFYTLAPVTNAAVSTTLDSRTAVTDRNGIFSLITTIPATNSSFTYSINVSAGGYNSTSISSNWPVPLQNLDVHLVPPPNNDNFASRIPLTGAATNTSASSLGASKEANEPDHAGNAGGKSVWWRWTAPSAGELTIDTLGSDFDTLLGVYRGTTLPTLIEEASSEDTQTNTASAVTFTVTNGVTYQIAVDGLNGEAGTVQLNLLFYGPPANDRFVNRIPLMGTNVSVIGENFVATKDTGEPAHWGGESGGKSVWWSWTATNSRPVTISTAGSDFDTVLAVYTGTAVGSLTLQASDDSTGDGGTGEVTFNVEKDKIYMIAVDGFSPTDRGNIALTITQP